MTKHINIDEILSNCVDKAYEIMDSKSFANPYTDAKQQLYDLMLEIIGEDYIFERPKDDYLPNVYQFLKGKNELRATQRQKATDLFKGDKE